MYTLRDVNNLIMDRGWPRMLAMEFYMGLGEKTGEGVSETLDTCYHRELRKFPKEILKEVSE